MNDPLFLEKHEKKIIASMKKSNQLRDYYPKYFVQNGGINGGINYHFLKTWKEIETQKIHSFLKQVIKWEDLEEELVLYFSEEYKNIIYTEKKTGSHNNYIYTNRDFYFILDFALCMDNNYYPYIDANTGINNTRLRNDFGNHNIIIYRITLVDKDNNKITAIFKMEKGRFYDDFINLEKMREIIKQSKKYFCPTILCQYILEENLLEEILKNHVTIEKLKKIYHAK
jgi:hypothetical protein